MKHIIIILFLIFIHSIFSQDCSSVYSCLLDSQTGWTKFVESISDTQKIYVSNSEGDDDLNDGLTESTPVKTVSAGKALIRDTYPDWLLFKRGDEWHDEKLGKFEKGGRSSSEPIVIGSYGSISDDRPVFYVSGTFLFVNDVKFKHIAIVELHISGKYDNVGADPAITFFGPTYDVLIEDVVFEEVKQINFQRLGGYDTHMIEKIVMRRSQIVNNYPRSNAHSQGIFGSGFKNVIFEENLFYHNGWTQNQDYITNNGGYGGATIFNHNHYLHCEENFIVRNNLYIRPSSINMKFFNAGINDDGPPPSKNFVISNNLIWGGEVGMSLGGTSKGSSYVGGKNRFVNVIVEKNVFSDVGETISETGGLSYTGRSLSFYCNIIDNTNTTISMNLFMNNPYSSNAYGLKLGGTQNTDIVIIDNVVNNFKGGSFLRFSEGEVPEGYYIVKNNVFQEEVNDVKLVDFGSEHMFDHVDFDGNTFYSSQTNMDDWFNLKSGESVNDWLDATNAITKEKHFPYPERTLETYVSDLSLGSTVEDFVAEARKQSKYNWREELTASAVNEYLREGFNMTSSEFVHPSKKDRGKIILQTIGTIAAIVGGVIIVVIVLLVVVIGISAVCFIKKKKGMKGSFIELKSEQEVGSKIEMNEDVKSSM